MTPFSGSSTSPVPVRTSETSGDNHHRLEAPQIAIGAPSFASSTAGRELPGVLFELAFQTLKQGKRVRGGTGESANYIALAQSADFFRVGFDDGLADRDLAVSADNYAATLADGQDGRAMPGGKFVR